MAGNQKLILKQFFSTDNSIGEFVNEFPYQFYTKLRAKPGVLFSKIPMSNVSPGCLQPDNIDTLDQIL